jgi:hypothetical protein
LSYEISAKALSRIVDRSRGALEVGGAKQANEPVAQIFPLQKNENNEKENDAGGSYRRKQRTSQSLKQFKRLWLRLMNFHHNRLAVSHLLRGARDCPD